MAHRTVTRISPLLLAAWLAFAPACMGDRQLFPETSYKTLDEDRIALVTESTPLPGLTLPAGTEVKFVNDRIAGITLSRDATLDGIVFPEKSELVLTAMGQHLEMAHAVLGRDHTYDELALGAGDKVRFARGKLVWAHLASERDFGGTTYPAHAELTIEAGRVVRVSTQEERAAKAEAESQARRRRYDDCTMQCAPLTGVSRADCINHCQTYR